MLFTYDAGDCPSHQTGLAKEKQGCLIHSSDSKIPEQHISGMSGADQETPLKDISNANTWLRNHNGIWQRKVLIQSSKVGPASRVYYHNQVCSGTTSPGHNYL